MSTRLMCMAVAGLVLCSGSTAQRRRADTGPDPARDPYTRMEPAAISRAGYVSLGPFDWNGSAAGTRAVERAMGDIGLRWVETEHFRIGSSLGAFSVPPKDRELQRRLRAELLRLRGRLPRVKVRRTVKSLDPWLRAHLFAMRLEETYGAFTDRIADLCWKRAADSPVRRRRVAEPPIGNGPYLGMPGKFCVLLFDRWTSLERYNKVFLGGAHPYPRRHLLAEAGSALFVTAANVHGGAYVHDTALHCHVTFGVVHNFVQWYRGNFYTIPTWWSEGVAHWFARRVEPRWCNFTSVEDLPDDITKLWDWSRFAYRLVERDEARPAPEMLRWLDYRPFTFRDHIVAWSRVDFLLRRDPSGFGVFLDTIKGKGILRSKLQWNPAEVLDAQQRALHSAWRLTPATLDAEWKKFVLASYRPEVARR